MAYDGELAARLAGYLEGLPDVSEKRMMGGCCFFINGNMVGGADRAKSGERRFMFRVGKDNVPAADVLPGGEAMVQGGRNMTGFYFVNADEADDRTIRDWVSLAVSHAMTLPVK